MAAPGAAPRPDQEVSLPDQLTIGLLGGTGPQAQVPAGAAITAALVPTAERPTRPPR